MACPFCEHPEAHEHSKRGIARVYNTVVDVVSASIQKAQCA